MTAPAAAFPVRPEHVAAVVEPLLLKTRSAGAVGLHVAGPWTGGDTVTVAGHAHPVAWCASELAFREALERHADADGPRLILLTPVEEAELARDVRARLVRLGLLSIEPWALVAELFHTRDVDPRITPHPWLAEVLLETAPAGGYDPLPGAVLDADTAWQHVLARTLGLGTARPDADALLEASAEPAFAARYARLAEHARAAVACRIRETAGPLRGVLMRALAADRAAELVALRLACEVVYPDGGSGGVELSRAAARLELYTGGEPIDPALGRLWAQSALRVLGRLADDDVHRVLQQAEDLLGGELSAGPLSGLSTALPPATSAGWRGSAARSPPSWLATTPRRWMRRRTV